MIRYSLPMRGRLAIRCAVAGGLIGLVVSGGASIVAYRSARAGAIEAAHDLALRLVAHVAADQDPLVLGDAAKALTSDQTPHAAAARRVVELARAAGLPVTGASIVGRMLGEPPWVDRASEAVVQQGDDAFMPGRMTVDRSNGTRTWHVVEFADPRRPAMLSPDVGTQAGVKAGDRGGFHAVAPVLAADGSAAGFVLLQLRRGWYWEAVLPTVEGVFYAALAATVGGAGLAGLLGGAAGLWAAGCLDRVRATLESLGAGELGDRIEPLALGELDCIGEGVNKLAHELQTQKMRQESLGLARQVQQALLPQRLPAVSGAELAVVCDYCDETGGDYYDFVDLQDDAGVAVLVGDGTGHGVPAALLMAGIRAVVRGRRPAATDLAGFLQGVNRDVCAQIPEGKFMTLLVLALERRPDGRPALHWASAGHDAALLFDPVAGRFLELAGEDLPLGVEASWSFSQRGRESPLARGEVVVIGTDGIWEMRSAAGRMFGKDSLQRVVRKHFNESAEGIGAALMEALRQHRGEARAQDDVTFVVIKGV